MIHLNQRAVFFPQNLYVIDINRRNRNYYSCGGFGYLAKNCRNRENRIGEERRLEYGQNNEQRLMIKEEQGQSNLNGK